MTPLLDVHPTAFDACYTAWRFVRDATVRRAQGEMQIMEYFPVTKTSQGFQIEGFPEAVKVVRITGRDRQRLADLGLHKRDLDFALECLTAINQVPEQPGIVREALWRSAIVHFIKCFGKSKSRSAWIRRACTKVTRERLNPASTSRASEISVLSMTKTRMHNVYRRLS